MKIVNLTLLNLILLIGNSFAQNQGHIGFSQSFSTFKYKSSTGEKDEFIDSEVKSGTSIGYNLDLPSVLDLRMDLSLLNLGARAAYDNLPIKWDLNYINFSTNFGVRLKESIFQPYALAGPYISYLYKGSQEIDGLYYNIRTIKAIKKIDLGANILYGLNFNFSKDFMLFIEGRHTIGLNQIEKEDDGQSLYNRSFSILVGVKLNFN